MLKNSSLIRTKLHRPFIRAGLVSRPHLQSHLVQGLCGPLTLVTAPAGFGKTTLVASAVFGVNLPVAWLSLDKNDNQALRFLTYLLAALHEVDSSLAGEAEQLLAGSQQVSPETVLTSLINGLDHFQQEIILVLDDYQFINNQSVHDQVAFLLEHCPTTFHLVIATRSDPPLPLSRLRARGQTVELRAADLRFTVEEAAQFLNEVMGLQLNPRAIAVLEDRTEGWIAGLQMAALSMHDCKDTQGFIERFSGTHRHILDYLLEEVLTSQGEDIQLFLLYTSILERLSAPLCDALWVTAEVPAGEASQPPEGEVPNPPRSAASILAYLEQANLFLIPLDDDRIWYRYHHLFADLLASQLMHTHSQLVPTLHLRASAWYEQNGWLEQAIEHAFSAGDVDRVAGLVEGAAQKLIYQVPFETMQNWIKQLPEEMVLKRAWIGITQGWLWVTKMQVSRLDSWMDNLEQSFLAGENARYSAGEQQDIRANIASLRAYNAFFKGDLRRSVELSSQALALLSPANVDLRVRVLVQLGETYLALQDLQQASQYLANAVDAAIAVADFQSITTASMRLYKALKTLGRLNEAEEMLHRVADVLSQAGRLNSPVATKLEQCLGDLFRERGQMAEAGAQLSQALTHARRYNSPLDIVTTLIYQSMWLENQGDLVAAQRVLEEAELVMRASTLPLVVIASWSLQRARVCLENGEIERAEQYVPDSASEETHLFRSRILLKKGELDQAQNLLSQLEQHALQNQHYGGLVQILLLQASLLAALGEQAQALDALVSCLNLAHTQSYRMAILAEGEPIHKLLQRLRGRSLSQPLSVYVLQLLQTFEQKKASSFTPVDAGGKALSVHGEKSSQAEQLVEPLSQRELDVLSLLALGNTNQEIAQQLVVAPGTVKAHTASIYRKLDVANRTEAVARARQLGILL